jgi:hypothetical protein
MYPRNAANPEPIAIGAVVQISDGAVQTTGCTVRIKPIGVAEGDGGGTTAYSTDGIVLYTPTQAETNYTSFILIAKKTGCIPACVTVVTTASSVPGRTVPADGSITAAVIATDAIDADAIKADAVTEIQAGLSTLTQTQVTGGAYALNSASFAFNAGLDFTTTQKAATLARVTLVDTTTTNTDMRGTDNAALAATALSTATWTNGLATNLGTTNSTVATNLDATVSSRLAAASYTAPANSDITAIKAKTDNLPSDPADQSAVEAAITAATSPLATAANLATVQSDTNDIQTRLPAALVSGKMSSIAELDSAARVKLDGTQPDYAPATAAALTAMRGADNDTLKTLSEQIDGIDGGASLTGPFTRTVTVTDASTSGAIQNAKVRLFRTGETGSLQTNSGGVASFTVEAATWSYAITANGYTGTSGTIVVSANGDTAVQLMASSVTAPTDPALSAIEVLCLNANFAAASGIDIDFRMASVATGDQNRAHPGAKKTVTSNGSGIARFEGPQGATIEWKRGSGQQWTAVTLDNDSVTNVTSLIGSP